MGARNSAGGEVHSVVDPNAKALVDGRSASIGVRAARVGNANRAACVDGAWPSIRMGNQDCPRR